VKPILESRNEEKLLELARGQAEAGASFIDVNVGTGVSSEEEAKLMQWAVRTIQDSMDKPLCIDSADPAVLVAGLSAREGKPGLINSTKAEELYLEKIVPLAAEFNTPLVGLAMDETGIPKTVQGRLSACRKIFSMCEKHGVPPENIYFDALVIPVSTDDKQGIVTLETLAAVKKEFPVAKTVIGLSNVSYGLPSRPVLNAAFLNMAIFAGLEAVIMDPVDKTMMNAIKTAEALVGRDRHFRRFMRVFRKKR
jgi:5-methyltetrahydrofolate--homocysteine methyltransferase